MKKTLSLLLAVILAASMMIVAPFTASAAGEADPETEIKHGTDDFDLDLPGGDVYAESLEITALPDKLEYVERNVYLDLSGLEMDIFYSDGTTEHFVYNDFYDYPDTTENFDVTYEEDGLGEHTATIGYLGCTVDFTYYIVESPVKSIEITKLPDTVDYVAGNVFFDLAGLEMDIFYIDGTVEHYVYDYDSLEFNGEFIDVYSDDDNYDSVGKHTATIEYLCCTAEFAYYVSENPVESIEITKLPDKLEYIADYEYLDLEGIEVTVYFKDGTTEVLDYYSLWDSASEHGGIFDFYTDGSEEVGEHTATIEYLGCSAEFTYYIIESPVESIEITKLPDKLEYIAGYESVDFSGLEMDINYTDGTTAHYVYDEDFDEFNGYYVYLYEEYDSSAVGEHTATVEYLGCFDEFTYYLTENPVDKIEITKLPDKVFEEPFEYNDYSLNYDIDYSNCIAQNMSGAELTVSFKDGTVMTYEFGEYADGYDNPIYTTYFWEDTDDIIMVADWSNYLAIVSFMGVSTYFTAKSTGNENPVQPFTVDSSLYAVLPDNTAMLIEYTGSDAEVTVPSEVNGYAVSVLGDTSFYCNNNLESIVISDGITSIGSYSFMACINLGNIEIPDSVTKIGTAAFSETLWLNTQPAGVVYAGKVAYDYAYGEDDGEFSAIEAIDIKDGTKGIADYAFRFCDPETVTIPESMEYIGECAFFECPSLKSVIIPQGVTEIGEYAFGYVFPDYENLEAVDSSDLGSLDLGNLDLGNLGLDNFDLGNLDLGNLDLNALSEQMSDLLGNLDLENLDLENLDLGNLDLENLDVDALYEQLSDLIGNPDNYSYQKIEDFTIYGYKGTAAEAYAEEYGLDFVSLDDISYLPGDVNHDNIFDVNDVTYLQMHLAGYTGGTDLPMIDESNSIEFETANFNGDGILDINDVTSMQKSLAGYINI